MPPRERRSKPKLRKKTIFFSDYDHLLILGSAVVVLLVLLIVFYFASGKLLQKNFAPDSGSLSSNYWFSGVVESINYHGYQKTPFFAGKKVVLAICIEICIEKTEGVQYLD